MIRRILLTIVLLLATAYLIMAITVFNRKSANATCADVKLVIRDTVYAGFITKKEVLSMLRKQKLNPVGKDVKDVNTARLEEILSTHPLIDRVECYKTPSGKVCVEVSQRIPILRVMSSRGENYYLDNKGTVMPPSAKCVAHVPLATGYIEKSFAMKELYKFGVFLQQNPFWDAQIEQIYVHTDQNVELVPRVGDHLIYLGKLKDYERKLEHVKTFYKKALNQVGWNKYSRINVEFDNQIICTQKD
ncbi:MAG TPA: cell division protein FtsQ [Candidatus Bacteroides merdavium]|uniref:Cell division protein FtsQ n=1 Tax=Candidatus Bacteroides merdavium TaxID=2838472 RepID=A0A9D2KFB1_9BACE|nr:cell division protein FtsQ [uncultured Bacteroides sp.]HIZ92737.1 cell division protein FtsQ [Candidatus Bacteroides merdavium]